MQAIRRAELAKMLGVHPRTIDNWRKTGMLPPPMMLGSIPTWDMAEIQAWLQTRRAPK